MDQTIMEQVKVQIQEALKASSTQLLGHIDGLITEKLNSSSGEIVQQLKYNEPVVFKKKGNEAQYRHNKCVISWRMPTSCPMKML